MPPKDKYTDPKLREQVKEEVKESDKGGAPGQWSARKAQFMASEYKKRGGGYTTDKEHGQDESQKNLDNWGKEEWQTKEGSGEAKQEDGSRKRYLPKKAWKQMDDKEKEDTDAKKQAGSKKGKQFVGNTSKAKAARKNVSIRSPESEDEEGDDNGDGNDMKENKQDGDAESSRDHEDASDNEGSEDDDDNEEKESQKPGRKRTRNASKTEATPRKRQKDTDSKSKKTKGSSKGTMGSKHDSAEAPAPQGSNDRLPKKGQKVTWKAMPGWVHGKVLEIVTSSKSMGGKSIKASKDAPRIALEAESGKFCVHKPEACYFESE